MPHVEIEKDDRNCLVIHAPNIVENPIVTNDLVEILNHRQFVFLGRVDNVVNSGGIKLIPEQIEDKLASKIQSPFFVGGIPDATLGEKLVLVIEGDKKNALDDSVFDKLDKYEKPKQIFNVPQFSLTENGKIKRKEILKSIS